MKGLRVKKLLRVYPTGKTFNFPVGHRSLDLCFNKIIYLFAKKLLPQWSKVRKNILVRIAIPGTEDGILLRISGICV